MILLLAFNIKNGHNSIMIKVMLPKFVLDLSFVVISIGYKFHNIWLRQLKLENGNTKFCNFSSLLRSTMYNSRTVNPFNATQKNRKITAAAAFFWCSFTRTEYSFSDCCIFFIVRDTEKVIAWKMLRIVWTVMLGSYFRKVFIRLPAFSGNSQVKGVIYYICVEFWIKLLLVFIYFVVISAI